MSIFTIHIHMCRVMCWAVSHHCISPFCSFQIFWRIIHLWFGKSSNDIQKKDMFVFFWKECWQNPDAIPFSLREYFFNFHYASTFFWCFITRVLFIIVMNITILDMISRVLLIIVINITILDMILLSVQQQRLKIEISEHIAVKIDVTWRYAKNDMNQQKEYILIAHARTKGSLEKFR